MFLLGITAAGTEEPFRGLLYFDEPHAHLFFGRDGQVDDLLQKLHTSRFVAVLGSSASGKSSLVRAGLIPALRTGLLVSAGGGWTVIVARPGTAPIRALAEELAATSRTLTAAAIETTLRRGPLGLTEAVQQMVHSGRVQNVLIVIDQFEELFRFQDEAQGDRRQAAADESAAFVKLLLQASRHNGIPVYVVLTMRSDFLGRCAQYADLPERINDALYLVPRMGRDQLHQAMAGPIAVAGGVIERALIQQVLNDLGDDPDQLPVLQHALQMTWRRRRGALTLTDYLSTGALEDALSADANRVYDALSARGREIAQVLFQRLCSRDGDGRVIRRRARLDDVADVAGASAKEVSDVADEFVTAGLLTRSDDLVDVPHESLIRKWDRFQTTDVEKGWLDDEIEARDVFLDLVKRDERRRDEKDLLSGIELQLAQRWEQRGRRPAWARRYIDQGELRFVRVQGYIAESVSAELAKRQAIERERKTKARFKTLLTALAFALSLIVSGVAYYAFSQRALAMESERIANQNREVAEQQSRSATVAEAAAKAAALLAQNETKAKEEARLALDVSARDLKTSLADTQKALASEARAKELAGSQAVVAQEAKLEADRLRTVAENAAAAREVAQKQAEADRDRAVTLAAEQKESATKAQVARTEADLERNRSVLSELAARAQALQRPEDLALAAQMALHAFRLHLRTNCATPNAPAILCQPDRIDGNVIGALHSVLNRLTRRYAPGRLGAGGILVSDIADPILQIVNRGKANFLVTARRGNEAAGITALPLLASAIGLGAKPFVAGTATPGRAAGRAITALAVASDETTAQALLDGTVGVSPSLGWPSIPAGNVAVALAFSPKAGELVAATADGSLRRSIKASGSRNVLPAARVTLPPPPQPPNTPLALAQASARIRLIVRGLLYAPNGEQVFIATNQGLYVWDFMQSPVHLEESARTDVRSMAFSNTGDLAFGDHLGTITMATVIGSRLFGLRSFSHRHPSAVTALAFSPNGWLLASAGADGTVRLFRLDGGTRVVPAVFAEHTGKVESLAFQEDNSLLYSVGVDRSVRLWLTRMDALKKAICRIGETQLGALSASQQARLEELIPTAEARGNACALDNDAPRLTAAR